MSWSHIRLADVPLQPWKNGGGVTRELLSWPEAASWRARISVADVALDGPFSTFDGVQRWFAVLSGTGVVLTVDGQPTELRESSAAFEFSGEASTHCGLIEGDTQDINLMLRVANGKMRRVCGIHQMHLAASKNDIKLIATYSMNTVTTVLFGIEKTVLEPQTLIWRLVSDPVVVTVSSPHCIWMEIEP